MEGGSAKTILLGKRGQGSSCRISRDTKNELVTRIDIFFQADFFSLRSDRQVRQIEITAAGDLICEKVASGEIKFFKSPISYPLIKNIVLTFMHGQPRSFPKTKTLHSLR